MQDYFKIEKEGIRIRGSARTMLTTQMLRPFVLPFNNTTDDYQYSRNDKIVETITEKIQLEIDKIGGNSKHFTTAEWGDVEVELYLNIIEATKVDYFYFVKNAYLGNVAHFRRYHEQTEILKGEFVKLTTSSDIKNNINAAKNIYICYVNEDALENVKGVYQIHVKKINDNEVVYTSNSGFHGEEYKKPITSKEHFFCIAK
jgi:hypothetical protein